MEHRKRMGLGGLWFVVALLMANFALQPPFDPTSVADLAGLVAVGAGLFLAAVYVFDPYGLISERPF